MKEELKEIKRIKVLVYEKQTKEGKKFNTYKTVSKNGRLMDVKFRKEVKDLPEKNCFAVIACDNMNIDSNREYPVLWVNAVENYLPLDEVASEANKAKLDAFFD